MWSKINNDPWQIFSVVEITWPTSLSSATTIVNPGASGSIPRGDDKASSTNYQPFSANDCQGNEKSFAFINFRANVATS